MAMHKHLGDSNGTARGEGIDGLFSKLEASFAETKVVPRQNSIEMKDVNRHAQALDVTENDLDFNFDLEVDKYPLSELQSLHEVFPAILYTTHLSNLNNFSGETDVECFDSMNAEAGVHHLDHHGLKNVLKTLPTPSSPQDSRHIEDEQTEDDLCQDGRLLIFFLPLVPCKNTSFGSRLSMTQGDVCNLFEAIHVNPTYMMNTVGRPDYWSPQIRWRSGHAGRLNACDFFCQNPRWNLQHQGAPLSVYMRYCARTGLTTYIISHKVGDTSIQALQNSLKIAVQRKDREHAPHVLTSADPFNIAVILSSLSFEVSKHHVKRFQRYMWTQVNKVDDHLGGLGTNDTNRLSELTKSLQIISQQADSHLLNADVAIITAKAILDAHRKLHATLSTPERAQQQATDSISYVISSMEKQRMLFTNYKNRKDSTMSLVYNLVTQRDAANNIEMTADMKRDSTSMNAIAALTMVFLPGTFTASVMSAGIFSSVAHSRDISVSGIWWLWLVITLPLTVAVTACWWLYKRRKDVAKLKAPWTALLTRSRIDEPHEV
ncbi:MAG: hypothetical protein M1822_006234 [Bathelium mastoideum]|nr:MAG: hypothetical protein M1822_006234 [Bathelium mastoideum]